MPNYSITASVTYKHYTFEGYEIYLTDEMPEYPESRCKISETIIYNGKSVYKKLEPFWACGFYEMYLEDPRYHEDARKMIEEICIKENQIKLT